MAQQKIATLMGTERLGADTRLLSFSMTDGDLGFYGGQYIIIDSGIVIAGDKIAKRAYSILSTDKDQRQFQLAVRRIGDGPGSNFMHNLQPGAELKFSGPWGKLLADPGIEGDNLVFATDTGITAALGLLESRAMLSMRSRTRVIWLAESEDYFLPFHFVIEEFDRIGIRNFSVVKIPPVAHSARLQKAKELIEAVIADEMPSRAYLSGDGSVIYMAQETLVAQGMSPDSIRIECFFNNPQRKAAAA
jgi:ferredoxin-NADP reductase